MLKVRRGEGRGEDKGGERGEDALGATLFNQHTSLGE
jgi:hypothetical protein